jgi:hypothetical protein
LGVLGFGGLKFGVYDLEIIGVWIWGLGFIRTSLLLDATRVVRNCGGVVPFGGFRV